MNILADRLFNLLLGWTRSLFNSFWNLLTNDQQGFIGFLQQFWLPIIVLLLIAGTLMDYIIWMIRWRPYFVWRTWLRQRSSKRRERITRHYMDNLDHSPLNLPEYQHEQEDEVFYPVDEPVVFHFQQAGNQGDFQPAAPIRQQMPPAQEFVPVLPWEQYQAPPPPPPAQQQAVYSNEYVPEMDFIAQEDYLPVPEQETISSQPAASQSAAPARRRRSEARRGFSKAVHKIRETIRRQEQGPLDSLPPPVAQEDVFHEPYIPQNYVYRPQQPVHHTQVPGYDQQQEQPYQ